MPAIGLFQKLDDDTYVGRLNTLTIDNQPARILPVTKRSERSPDYRLYVRGAEVGAAWIKTSESGTQYLSVAISTPELQRTIYAILVAKSAWEPHENPKGVDTSKPPKGWFELLWTAPKQD